jgi:hypothetical protein
MKAGVYVTPCGSVILETRARVVEHSARSSNLSAGKPGLSGLTDIVGAFVGVRAELCAAILLCSPMVVLKSVRTRAELDGRAGRF